MFGVCSLLSIVAVLALCLILFLVWFCEPDVGSAYFSFFVDNFNRENHWKTHATSKLNAARRNLMRLVWGGGVYCYMI